MNVLPVIKVLANIGRSLGAPPPPQQDPILRFRMR